MSRACCKYLLLFVVLSVGLSGILSPEANAGRLRDKMRKNRTPSPAHSAVPALVPESFSGRLTVTGDVGQILSFSLEQSVYSGLLRQDFRDLCVFDAKGTPVPFVLASPEEQKTRTTVHLADIRAFPWPSGDREQKNSDSRQRVFPGKTDVEIDTEGGIIRIHTSRTEADAGDESGAGTPPPDGLLLDMHGALEKSPPEGFKPGDLHAISLVLEPDGAASFSTSVEILGSNNLESWRACGAKQSLARITRGAESIDKLVLNLPVPSPKYVLLKFSGDIPRIASVAGEALFSRDVVLLDEGVIAGRLSEDRKTVLYDVPGRYPLSAVNLELSSQDIVAARLEVRSGNPDFWRTVFSKDFYRMEKDGVLSQNEAISMYWPGSNEWRLRKVGEIPFSNAPGIRLFWKPHTLFFFAGGTGPWTVAYGNKLPVDVPPLPANMLEAAQKAQVVFSPLVQHPAAVDGDGREGRDNASSSQKESSGGAVLWGAMILVVAFMAGVVFYLMRSMKTTQGRERKISD